MVRSPRFEIFILISIHQRIRRTIKRHVLCRQGANVLVALSGGSDSVALLWLMLELAEVGDINVTAAAHFNHRLRSMAKRDEEFCRELTTRAGVNLIVGSSDVRQLAQVERLSVEDAARRERYAFLARTAAEISVDCVATGHTQDDQAETLLLKIVRGAGMRGLGGIYPVRGLYVRPLLDVTREELQEYLRVRGDRWMDDESNQDLTNPRNRMRHVTLPFLEQASGMSVRTHLSRTAILAGEDAILLDRLAAAQLHKLGHRSTNAMDFDSRLLRALPASICRRVLLEAMRSQSAREIGFDHVEAALDVLWGRSRAAQTPGGRWELLEAKLFLVQKPKTLKANSFSYALQIPGEVDVPEGSCRITAERLDLSQTSSFLKQRLLDNTLAISSEVKELVVRSRHPGDRLVLPGGRGRKKVKDLFIDAKVPRPVRDTIPVVATPDGRVVWIPGYGTSADFELSEFQGGVILLKLSRVGGKA